MRLNAVATLITLQECPDKVPSANSFESQAGKDLSLLQTSHASNLISSCTSTRQGVGHGAC